MSTDIENILSQLKNHEARIAALEKLDRLRSKPPDLTGDGTGNNQNLEIANKINDCDESAAATKILLSKNMEAKLLLCFFVSHKYLGNRWLTTGDLEEITSEIGGKLDKANVSNKLKSLRQYLESGASRRRGQPTPYRFNRKGIARFEEILRAAKA